MKKTIVLLVLISVAIVTMAQKDSLIVNKKFGWNNDIGIGLGYSYIHSPLSGDKFVDQAPCSLISADLWLWGLYAGFDGGRHKTGYDVYGYDELVTTFLFKVGPLFRYELGGGKMLLNPYVGGLFVSVKDNSNNEIGARTKYGTHESCFVIGARVGFQIKHFVFGIHGSNKEIGGSVGFAIEPRFSNLW